MDKKILSIIPARGGSKGLPRKNVLEIAGKPLVVWSIEASINSKCISKTVVSSDDEEILSVSKKAGAYCLKRPQEYASDTASSEVVVEHVLKTIDEKFDYVVLLQPTSPLRDVQDIDEAFEKLFNEDASALISVKEIDNKVLKAFKENKNGYIEGISNNEFPFMRRQDLPKTYISNGAIYIIHVEQFLKNNSFFTNQTIPFVMNDVKSLDIDTIDDFESVQNHLLLKT